MTICILYSCVVGHLIYQLDESSREIPIDEAWRFYYQTQIFLALGDIINCLDPSNGQRNFLEPDFVWLDRSPMISGRLASLLRASDVIIWRRDEKAQDP